MNQVLRSNRIDWWDNNKCVPPVYPLNMHVVVVGGGIVGLASAYFLSNDGVHVTICEQSTIGAGSTERSVGGIRSQFSTAVNIELSKVSVQFWEEFEEQVGTDIAFTQNGYLFLARSEETASAFRANVERQHERGIDSELVTPNEATAYSPALHDHEFVLGTYYHRDGFADPHLALQGLKQALDDRSVTVKTGTEVTDIDVTNDIVTGVETDRGSIDCDFVINATGPWASEVAAMGGVDLPIEPKRRQVGIVEPVTPVPTSEPLTIDLDRGFYFRPERDGKALAGGHFSDDDPTQDPDVYTTGMDLDWTADLLERGMDVVEYFGMDAGVVDGWAGLYSVTPDNHPIIEESRPGFINAVGFSGHGFQHAPATGKLVAELVLSGEASTVDIGDLSADRFESGDLLIEENVA